MCKETKPFFSIVVCTRNRPDIIKYCVLSFKNQSFQDFEVILSDNSDPEIQKLNYAFIQELCFKQIRYIRPERILNMHENYNFGLQHAQGQYIGVLTDKNFFIKHALRDLYFILCENKVDIINYNNGGCRWYPKKILFKWVLDHYEVNPTVEKYSPAQELLRRFNLDKSIRKEGIRYNFGKIFFGFYHYSLIDKIIQFYGQVFHPTSPDYTSTVLALELAKEAIFYHKKIMIAVNNYSGTGYNGQNKPNFTINFLKNCIDNPLELLNNLPVPNVHTLHNLCAYDYLVLNRFGNTKYNLNIKNLIYLIKEDLQIYPFASQEEKEKLLGYYYNFVNSKLADFNIDKLDNFLIDSQNKKNNRMLVLYRLCKKIIIFLFFKSKINFIKYKWSQFRHYHYRYLEKLLN